MSCGLEVPLLDHRQAQKCREVGHQCSKTPDWTWRKTCGRRVPKVSTKTKLSQVEECIGILDFCIETKIHIMAGRVFHEGGLPLIYTRRVVANHGRFLPASTASIGSYARLVFVWDFLSRTSCELNATSAAVTWAVRCVRPRRCFIQA